VRIQPCASLMPSIATPIGTFALSPMCSTHYLPPYRTIAPFCLPTIEVPVALAPSSLKTFGLGSPASSTLSRMHGPCAPLTWSLAKYYSISCAQRPRV
jgi:hypothetical protein